MPSYRGPFDNETAALLSVSVPPLLGITLLSSLSTSLTVPRSLLFFPLSPPFNSFLLVPVIHLGKILALAESLALNAQSYSMPFFLVCKSTNQHIIVCSPQLFLLLLSIHWLFSKDISPPACNLNLEFS